MRRALAITLFLAELTLASSNAVGAQDRISEKQYPELIRQATSFMFRARGPTESEKKKAESAMALLVGNREEVGPYIISQLKAYKPSADDAGLNSGHYGIMLWQFGPEYVRMLEPAVLQSKNEDARVACAYILGHSTDVPWRSYED